MAANCFPFLSYQWGVSTALMAWDSVSFTTLIYVRTDFYLEDGGRISVRKISTNLSDYTVPLPTRLGSEMHFKIKAKSFLVPVRQKFSTSLW